MSWSVILTYKKYLGPLLLAQGPLIYLYFAGVAILLCLLLGVHSLTGALITAVSYFLLMFIAFCVAGLWRLRRMRRLSGTSTINYEIKRGRLRIWAGNDAVTVPVTD